ncbi:hypothetical protein EXIGLDRAFT_112758 [Exidia glandulosa HHB12029]|uniref:Uncharacterized protein n=1 Tax=Exidia glandulosa HHB12029 TaxID=1314781 RepID=A0A165NMT8_EXIGL|nr:hypothetical protein EXIGLDRAFT_112758 [Exidia glandulosa HHB12029]
MPSNARLGIQNSAEQRLQMGMMNQSQTPSMPPPPPPGTVPLTMTSRGIGQTSGFRPQAVGAQPQMLAGPAPGGGSLITPYPLASQMPQAPPPPSGLAYNPQPHAPAYSQSRGVPPPSGFPASQPGTYALPQRPSGPSASGYAAPRPGASSAQAMPPPGAAHRPGLVVNPNSIPHYHVHGANPPGSAGPPLPWAGGVTPQNPTAPSSYSIRASSEYSDSLEGIFHAYERQWHSDEGHSDERRY